MVIAILPKLLVLALPVFDMLLLVLLLVLYNALSPALLSPNTLLPVPDSDFSVSLLVPKHNYKQTNTNS